MRMLTQVFYDGQPRDALERLVHNDDFKTLVEAIERDRAELTEAALTRETEFARNTNGGAALVVSDLLQLIEDAKRA